MKRKYTVNFDFFVNPEKVDGFTLKYTLFEKYADKFFDELRRMNPEMNIYVVRSVPVND